MDKCLYRIVAIVAFASALIGAGHARADTCSSLAALGLFLDGTHDDAPAFNSVTSSAGSGACFILPAGKTMGVQTVTATLSKANQQLRVEPGGSIKLLSSASGIGNVFAFAASGTSSVDLVIDVNGGGGQTIAGITTSKDTSGLYPTGVRLLGRTVVTNSTSYGARFNDLADVYVEDFYAQNTSLDCFHAVNGTNPPDIGIALITINRLRCDRSMINNASIYPDVQVVGTGDHPTTLFAGDLDLTGVINPMDALHRAEGAEFRHVTGAVAKVKVVNGSIGVSIASGTQNFTVGHIAVQGANIAGVEVGSSESVPTKNVVVNAIEVNGLSPSTGNPITPRAVSVDGAAAGSDLTIGNIQAAGFTDDGIGIFGSSGSWSNVTIGTADIDGSSIGNGLYPDYNGVYLLAQAGGSVSNVNLGTITVHGGGTNHARACIKLRNVSGVTGNLACDNIESTRALVNLSDDGTVLATMDNVNLTISDMGNNPTTGQVTTTLSNGGTIGNAVRVDSQNFAYGTKVMLGTGTPTFSSGELAGQTISATNTAPGAGFWKIEGICVGGKLRIIAYAGTSIMPTTIVDGVGGSVC